MQEGAFPRAECARLIRSVCSEPDPGEGVVNALKRRRESALFVCDLYRSLRRREHRLDFLLLLSEELGEQSVTEKLRDRFRLASNGGGGSSSGETVVVDVSTLASPAFRTLIAPEAYHVSRAA